MSLRGWLERLVPLLLKLLVDGVLEDRQLIVGVDLELGEAKVLVAVACLGLVSFTNSLLKLLKSLVVHKHLHIFVESGNFLACSRVLSSLDTMLLLHELKALQQFVHSGAQMQVKEAVLAGIELQLGFVVNDGCSCLEHERQCFLELLLHAILFHVLRRCKLVCQNVQDLNEPASCVRMPTPPEVCYEVNRLAIDSQQLFWSHLQV